MLLDAAIIILAYLCGSLASAVIVCRCLGLSDPRTDGSGNPGATNVLRLHGKQAAAITLVGDVLKGVIPVLIAKALTLPDLTIACTGLAAFSGHLFPVFFGFKGGKGVATLIGVLTATSWMIGVAFILIWIAMALLFRISSLSALTASLLIPLVSFYLLPAVYSISQIIMVVLIFWRHRSNIKKILNGTEDKIGSKR